MEQQFLRGRYKDAIVLHREQNALNVSQPQQQEAKTIKTKQTKTKQNKPILLFIIYYYLLLFIKFIKFVCFDLIVDRLVLKVAALKIQSKVLLFAGVMVNVNKCVGHDCNILT